MCRALAVACVVCCALFLRVFRTIFNKTHALSCRRFLDAEQDLEKSKVAIKELLNEIYVREEVLAVRG